MILPQIFGTLDNPLKGTSGGVTGYEDLPNLGLVKFLNNSVALITAVAGIWVVVNFIAAGYVYLSANGQPQKITDAGNKIMQSVIGLAIIAAAYVLAGILGFILYKDATFLLKPTLFNL